MVDAVANFAISTVATAPSPATSGTSLTVQTGDGALFPATPFNAVVWPTGTLALASNAEIVRVTGISGDTLTIARTQESTSARTIIVGDQIAEALTAKTVADLALPSTAYYPPDYPAIAWSFDPAMGGAAAPLVGREYYVRVKMAKTATINNLNIMVTAGAATQTHGFLSVRSLAGALLATTADQTTAWQTTGLKSPALTSGLAVKAGDEYLFTYLCAATTAASIAMGPSSPATNALLTAASPFRAGILAATGLIAPPSPAVMTGAGTSSNLPWIAAT